MADDRGDAELKELYEETMRPFVTAICYAAGLDPNAVGVLSSPDDLVNRIGEYREAWLKWSSLAYAYGVERQASVGDIRERIERAQRGFYSLARILGMDPDTGDVTDIVSRVESEHEALVAMRETMQNKIVAGLNLMPLSGSMEVSPLVPVPVPVSWAMLLVRLAGQLSPVAPGARRPRGAHVQSAGALWDEQVRISGWLLRLAAVVLDAPTEAAAQSAMADALAELARERSGGEGGG